MTPLLGYIERMRDEKPYVVKDLAEKLIQFYGLTELGAQLFATNNRGQIPLENAVRMWNAAGVELIVYLVLTGPRALVRVNTMPPLTNELLPRLNASIANLLACERELRDEPEVTTTDEVRERWITDVIKRTVGAAQDLIRLFAGNPWLEIVERSCNALRGNYQADEDELEVEHAITIGRWKGTAGETQLSMANKLSRIVRASVIGPCAIAVAYVLSVAQFQAVRDRDEVTLRLCLPDDEHLKSLINFIAVDNDGHSPLFYAVFDRNTTFIDLFLRLPGGVDFKAICDRLSIIGMLIRRDDVTTLAKIFNQAPQVLEHRNRRGHTPILMAAACGQLDCLKMLLERGANLWSVTNQMENVLHLAAAGGHNSILEYVLKCVQYHQGLSRRVLGAKETTQEWTPLHVGCFHGRANVVRTLLAYGADMDVMDRNWRLPAGLLDENFLYIVWFFRQARALCNMVEAGREELVVELVTAMVLEDRKVVCGARRYTKKNAVEEAVALGKSTLSERLKNLLRTD